MNSIMKKINAFKKDEKGVTMVEYGLIAALITVVCVVSVRAIGTNLAAKFSVISTCVSGGACS